MLIYWYLKILYHCMFTTLILVFRDHVNSFSNSHRNIVLSEKSYSMQELLSKWISSIEVFSLNSSRLSIKSWCIFRAVICDYENCPKLCIYIQYVFSENLSYMPISNLAGKFWLRPFKLLYLQLNVFSSAHWNRNLWSIFLVLLYYPKLILSAHNLIFFQG